MYCSLLDLQSWDDKNPRLEQHRNEERFCVVGAYQCLETENNNQL